MIEFKLVELSDKYRKKWNESSRDFINLYKDGKKISNTLYRIGGFGKELKDGYFMLLKHVEAYYEDSITKEKDKKPHLESQWCILNENGIEKVNFKQFEDPYLWGGLIYSSNNNYYNIETKEFYCRSYKSMNTKQFIFLHNEYDKDESKQGVMKINKFDGSYELFK